MHPCRLLFPALLVLAATGCDSAGNQQLDTIYVVESVLVAGEPMPPLLLSRIGGIDDVYRYDSQAESNADVSIQVTGAVANETIRYRESVELAGLYVAGDYSYPVLPLHRYSLTVQPFNSDQLITASTLVPDTFKVVRSSASQLVYQGDEQLELRLTPSHYPGREQSYFIFVTEALDAFESNLVPFARERYDDGDGESLEELRVNGSPIVNEGNYELNDDGTITVRYPWIGLNFYGPNILHVNALDDNVFNFERSRSVQETGSTFAPGEIPNPLPHVSGAHGLFGSQARISYRFTVVPQ